MARTDDHTPREQGQGPASPAFRHALTTGAVFAQRYRLIRRISTGGMAEVYEVEHLGTRRRLALKVLLPEVMADQASVERFQREATVCANIDSEHIVDVIDCDVDAASGMPFLVMELLHGRDLAQYVQETWGRGVPIPASLVLTILRQVAAALDRVHAQGIVHRDLKPANLFLSTPGDGAPRVKILDFGVAKLVHEKRGSSATRLGTPLYMSPEQLSGRNVVSPATDVWALALIAYELLVGVAYWEGNTAASLMERIPDAKQHPLPSTMAAARGVKLGAAFDRWLLRAIDPDPARRPQTAGEAVGELLRLFDPSATQPPSRSNSQRPAPVVASSPELRDTHRDFDGGGGKPTIRTPGRSAEGALTIPQIPAAPRVPAAETQLDGTPVDRDGERPTIPASSSRQIVSRVRTTVGTAPAPPLRKPTPPRASYAATTRTPAVRVRDPAEAKTIKMPTVPRGTTPAAPLAPAPSHEPRQTMDPLPLVTRAATPGAGLTARAVPDAVAPPRAPAGTPPPPPSARPPEAPARPTMEPLPLVTRAGSPAAGSQARPLPQPDPAPPPPSSPYVPGPFAPPAAPAAAPLTPRPPQPPPQPAAPAAAPAQPPAPQPPPQPAPPVAAPQPAPRKPPAGGLLSQRVSQAAEESEMASSEALGVRRRGVNANAVTTLLPVVPRRPTVSSSRTAMMAAAAALALGLVAVAAWVLLRAPSPRPADVAAPSGLAAADRAALRASTARWSQALLARQNADGGFGAAPSSPTAGLFTAQAFVAILRGHVTGATVEAARQLRVLAALDRARTPSGWGDAPGAAATTRATAWATLAYALMAQENRAETARARVRIARDVLVRAQRPDGSFADAVAPGGAASDAATLLATWALVEAHRADPSTGDAAAPVRARAASWVAARLTAGALPEGLDAMAFWVLWQSRALGTVPPADAPALAGRFTSSLLARCPAARGCASPSWEPWTALAAGALLHDAPPSLDAEARRSLASLGSLASSRMGAAREAVAAAATPALAEWLFAAAELQR